MIQEPQRTYVLELWNALGSAAENFVLVGGQALKFTLPDARATKDFDFVLDVVSIRELGLPIGRVLEGLGYTVIPESRRNFQFEKRIPNTPHVMRIELMGPAGLERQSGFRIAVDAGVHARACDGGEIALAESDVYEITGVLPTGERACAPIRVTRPHALVLMKVLAMDDRYRNLRGMQHYEHDRESARVHVADIVAVLSAQVDPHLFRTRFIAQLDCADGIRERAARLSIEYFSHANCPGLLLYEEYLHETLAFDDTAEITREVSRAEKLVQTLAFS